MVADMTGFRDLRQNHDFTVLWVGQTISELGTRVSMFVFPLVTFAVTGSPLMAGIAGGLELLGTAIALLPGGLLADRVHRGRVMRAAAGAGVLLYASLVVAGGLGVLTVPHLFVVGVLTGVCAGVFAPAEMSAVRAVVPREQLPTALSQQQARQHVAGLVGGPLGGALYSVTRWVPFLFDAVTFAVSWVMLGRIRTDLSPVAQPADAGAVRRRARDNLADGFRFQWSQPFFRTLMAWGMCSNLMVNALFTAATVRLIQAGFAPWSIGLVETAAGVCGVLGALAAPRIIERTPTGVLTVVVAWSFVPLLVPMVFWNNPVVVMISLSAGVFLNPAGNAGIGSYKMSITPPDIVGRVQATGQFLGWSTMPLAPVLGGALLAVLGGPATMAALVVLCAVVALIPTLSRTVRSVPRPAEWATPTADAAPEPALA
jgi:predicted MFS family arabinose efflux permease